VQTTAAAQNTYLWLYRGLKAMPVTPNQLQLVVQLLYITVYNGRPQSQVRVRLDDLTCNHLAQTFADQLGCCSLLQAETVEQRQVSRKVLRFCEAA